VFKKPLDTIPSCVMPDGRALVLTYADPDKSNRSYDTDAEGQRLLAAHVPELMRPRTVKVVVNWFTGLGEAR
jgi:hypothetical protein